MPIFGDTTTGIANFSEIIDTVVALAEALELEYAVMGNLVTRREIPRGQDRVRIAFQTDVFEAQDYTDGDEISVVQQMGVDTIDLTTNQLTIAYRVSDRAMRFSAVDLAALCGDEQAKAQAEALEVRLLALLDDTGTIDLGTSGADTTLGHFRASRRLLRNVARASGGPARPPIYAVINPIQEEDLLMDLGVAGAREVASTNTVARVIPQALQSMIEVAPGLEDAFAGTFVRIPTFVSGYIASTIGSVTAPSIGGVFAQKALILGVSKDWDVTPFQEFEWPGIIVRAMTDYGTRLGPFPSHVIQFDTAIT